MADVKDVTGGLNEAALADRDEETLGGTGGSSGGGTIAGAGEPSGGTTDQDIGTLGARDGLIAAEAAALGDASGSLANAAAAAAPGADRLSAGPVGGETV